MTLTHLKSILRSHYQELQNFSKSYLSSLKRKQTLQEFLLRAMDLKGKIIKASAEEVTGPQYNH